MTKHRAPIEQLRHAGKMAQEMLIGKGIQAKTSLLAEIMASKNAPVLPGIPPYLPQKGTLKESQRMMRDFLIMWRDKHKTDQRLEDFGAFSEFVIQHMIDMEHDYNREIVNTPKMMKMLKNTPVMRDIFNPMYKKQALRAMRHFFSASFVVAGILKQKHSTSEYADWFLTWTQELYKCWLSPEERKTFTMV